MKTQYVYPGSFCPPTYGHLAILKRAAEFLPEVVVVCSENRDKVDRWFSPEVCKEMWKTYALPENVRITTFDEFVRENNVNGANLVMIRGIRGDADLEQEKKVVAYNSKKFGIDKYLYILSDDEHKDISSTKAREVAEGLNLEELARFVSPLAISALLEKVLDIKNLFMVVGRPGSGKSTFLKMLAEENAVNIHINTDEFNKKLMPLISKSFPGKDVYGIVLERENELLEVITSPWLELLKKALRTVPKQTNVFVEIPYGLEANKSMFQYLGGKVLYVGCEEVETNKRRNDARGTPNIEGFIEKIPGKEESEIIAKNNGLRLTVINTDGSLDKLSENASLFNRNICEEKLK